MRLRTVPLTVSPSLISDNRRSCAARDSSSATTRAIHHHVFFGHIELGDAAADLLSDQFLHLRSFAYSGAGSGHECAHSDVHADTAFDHLDHGAQDCRLFIEGLFQSGPIRGTLDLAADEVIVAFRIAA